MNTLSDEEEFGVVQEIVKQDNSINMQIYTQVSTLRKKKRPTRAHETQTMLEMEETPEKVDVGEGVNFATPAASVAKDTGKEGSSPVTPAIDQSFVQPKVTEVARTTLQMVDTSVHTTSSPRPNPPAAVAAPQEFKLDMAIEHAIETTGRSVGETCRASGPVDSKVTQQRGEGSAAGTFANDSLMAKVAVGSQLGRATQARGGTDGDEKTPKPNDRSPKLIEEIGKGGFTESYDAIRQK